MSIDSILDTKFGLIEAPAGCGKTHLITETLNIPQSKPYLVLTHTTAGVAALKQRLKRLGVSNKNYAVTTIDGFAKLIANSFPASCDIRETTDNLSLFYPELRKCVNRYLSTGNIAEVISASYSRLLIDEYQDCNVDQHELICSLSDTLPTVVFGDPMQCIFNFSGAMPSWNGDVKSKFPLITELNTPWRWINAGAQALGEWILNCRSSLLQGNQINLSTCPEHIFWHRLTGNPQNDQKNHIQIQYGIRNNNASTDSLLVIGDSMCAQLRHNFASAANGIDVVESVDMKDVITLAANIDSLNGIQLVEQILQSTSSMMTGVGRAKLMKRIPTILSGRNRNPPSELELLCVKLIESGDIYSIADIFEYFELCSDIRIYRRGAFSAIKKAISLSISDPSKTVKQAAEVVREQRRHQGDKRIPLKAIGSTLLLKGLESDHALILDAGGMNSCNLYVALSRGAKSVSVFSRNVFLQP